MRAIACGAQVTLTAIALGLVVMLRFSSSPELSADLRLFVSVVVSALLTARVWAWIEDQRAEQLLKNPAHPFERYLESLVWGAICCVMAVWMYFALLFPLEWSLESLTTLFFMTLIAPVWFAPLIAIGSPILLWCWRTIYSSNHAR